ncbi:hypothetical protein LPJ72_004090, partial [Coemansia sp. Benny D160-2]
MLRSLCSHATRRQHRALSSAWKSNNRRRRAFGSLAADMATIKNTVDTNSQQFRDNAASMAAAVADLEATVAAAAQGGSERARQKHVARNKLLPRERVGRLLDAGAGFLELSQLAGHGLYGAEEAVPGGGIITGIGRIRGVEGM